MAVTNTPNINLNLPGKGEQNWDTLINQNFDKIDNEINTVNTQLVEMAAYVTPEMYGAKGDGVTDDTLAVQAALNAVPLTSVWVILSKKYNIPNGGLTVSRRAKISGVGGFDHQSDLVSSLISGLICSSPTADLLTINVDGCTFEDFGLINTSSTRPTSGAGLRLARASISHTTRTAISGFYNNLQIDAGWYYTITDCNIYDPVNFGIYLRNTEVGGGDHGDQTIHGCTISKVRDTVNGGTAVRWESGGGLRFVNNKINAGSQVSYTPGYWDYGLELLTDGEITGVFPITGNSIENANIYGINIGTKGTTGFLSKVQITGNEISVNSGGYGINISPGAIWNYADYIISSNTIYATRCIYAKNLDSWIVGQNAMRGAYHVFIDSGCSGYTISTDTANDSGTLVYNANQDNAPWYSKPVSDSRGIQNLASSTTLNLWGINMGGLNSACMVEATITGRMIGTGGGAVARTKQFFITASSGTPTVGTMIVDQKAGITSTLDIVATVSGTSVNLSAYHTDSGLLFRGNVTLRVSGIIFSFACL